MRGVIVKGPSIFWASWCVSHLILPTFRGYLSTVSRVNRPWQLCHEDQPENPKTTYLFARFGQHPGTHLHEIDRMPIQPIRF